LITDDASTETVPDWESSEEQVTGGLTTLVSRVLHRDEGDVYVRVWRGSAEPSGSRAFIGELRIDSGRLRVSDGLGRDKVTIEITPGHHAVAVYLHPPVEASTVDVVLDPVGDARGNH
jgi:hypothetical protein